MSFLQRVVSQVHAAAVDAPLARPKGLVPRVPEEATPGPAVAPGLTLPGETPAGPDVPARAPLALPDDHAAEPATPVAEQAPAARMTIQSEQPPAASLPAADAGTPSDLTPPTQDFSTVTDSVTGADPSATDFRAPLSPPPEQTVIPRAEGLEARGVTDAPPPSARSREVPGPVEVKAPSALERRPDAADATLSDVIAAVARPHPLPSTEPVEGGEVTPQSRPASAERPRTEIEAVEPQEIPPRQPVAELPLAQPLQSLEAMRQETDWRRPPEPPSVPDQPQLQIDQIDVVVSEPQPQVPNATARPAPLAAVSASRRYLRRL